MASIEYVLVAACLIGAVAAAFSPDVSAALTAGIGELGSLITTTLAG